MTIDELSDLLQSTNWFSRLGELVDTNSIEIPIEELRSLEEWKSVTGIVANEPMPEIVKRGMEWLPTQRDMYDPVHGKAMEARSEQLGKKTDFSCLSLGIRKKALVSLRGFEGHPALQVGPHNFTEAARGAVVFAAGRAAYEILLDDCGYWCSIMHLYHQGHWPCGILPDKTVVVY